MSGNYSIIDEDESITAGLRKSIYANGNSVRTLNSLRQDITTAQAT